MTAPWAGRPSPARLTKRPKQKGAENRIFLDVTPTADRRFLLRCLCFLLSKILLFLFSWWLGVIMVKICLYSSRHKQPPKTQALRKTSMIAVGRIASAFQGLLQV